MVQAGRGSIHTILYRPRKSGKLLLHLWQFAAYRRELPLRSRSQEGLRQVCLAAFVGPAGSQVTQVVELGHMRLIQHGFMHLPQVQVSTHLRGLRRGASSEDLLVHPETVVRSVRPPAWRHPWSRSRTTWLTSRHFSLSFIWYIVILTSSVYAVRHPLQLRVWNIHV